MAQPQLQAELTNNVGIPFAYFQPPESVRMSYPCVRYNLANKMQRHAGNEMFYTKDAYNLILMDYDPNSEYVDKLLALRYCKLDRTYAKDGLNHWVFTLYY